MSEAILIWIYLSLGNASNLATVIICIATACFLGFVIINAIGVAEMSVNEVGYDDRWENYKGMIKSTWAKMPTKTAALLMVVILAYPSKEDLKYIIGGSLVVNGAQAASDIEGVEKLPKNLVNAMNVFLEKAVEETK
jgi:hypothetical protein